MTAAELIAQLKRNRENVAALKLVYEDLFGAKNMPIDHQFKTWLSMYECDLGLEGIAGAFYRTAEWFNKTNGVVMVRKDGSQSKLTKTANEIVKYASGCMAWERKQARGIIPPHLQKKQEHATQSASEEDEFDTQAEEAAEIEAYELRMAERKGY